MSGLAGEGLVVIRMRALQMIRSCHLTDEVDAVLWSPELLDQMLDVLLQKTHSSLDAKPLIPQAGGETGVYLGGSEEGNGLQVLHAVSVLRVDAFKQVNLLLQYLRLSVHHADNARLKHTDCVMSVVPKVFLKVDGL